MDSDFASTDDELEQRTRDWNHLERTHAAIGIREGMEVGKEEYLQQGFNDGFEQGARLGFELEKLRGVISVVATQYAQLPIEHSPDEAKLLQEMQSKLKEKAFQLPYQQSEEYQTQLEQLHLQAYDLLKNIGFHKILDQLPLPSIHKQKAAALLD